MTLAHRRQVPVAVLGTLVALGALVALLVFAANAAAETRTGESTAPINVGSPPPEATIVKGAASYDTAGSARFEITTAAEPSPEAEVEMVAGFLSTSGSAACDTATLLALQSNPELIRQLVPVLEIMTQYSEPTAAALPLGGLGEPAPIPVVKTVSGSTTTLSLTSSQTASMPYDCVIVGTESDTESENVSLLAFPISAPQPPPPPPAPPTPPTPPAPAPAAVPAALTIHKLKPLKLRTEKWRTIKVRVTNTGGTATAQGSLRVKAPAKVLVKPEKQKLPALAPGSSWKLSVRVELTAKAKKNSRLSLIGTASGATTKSTLVIRRESCAAGRQHGKKVNQCRRPRRGKRARHHRS